MARGTFIARMDADDVSAPERFILQLEQMQRRPNLVALGTRYLLVDPRGRALCVHGIPLEHDEIDSQNLRGIGAAICHPSVMIRASALRQVAGYRADFWPAEDCDLFLRLAEIGEISNLPTVGLQYRMHHASIGHTHRATQISSACGAASAAYSRRGIQEPPVPVAAPTEASPDYRVTWAWWALRGKHLLTARRYAFAAFLRKPISLDRLRLLYCAIRGH